MRALCCKWQIVVFQGWNLSLPSCAPFLFSNTMHRAPIALVHYQKPKESAKDEEMVDVGWFLLGIWWIRFVIPEIGYFWVSIWIHICQKITAKNKKNSETWRSTNQYLTSGTRKKNPISGNNTWICHYFGRRRGTKKCAKQFWSFTILYNTCSCSLNNTVWEFWFFQSDGDYLERCCQNKIIALWWSRKSFFPTWCRKFWKGNLLFSPKKKPGYILKLLINSFFDEEKHFCKSTFSCQNFIVIVDL